jgi:hypothetical protein
MSTPCELCGDRAVMHFYCMKPGSPEPTPLNRGVSPFYPPESADFRINVCVPCFEVTAEQMRSEHHVALRATGVIPGNYKP